MWRSGHGRPGGSEVANARRRGHGDGGVYREEARNRWVGSLDLPPGPDGKRRRKKVTGRTRRDVLDRLADLHDQIERGVDLSGKPVTLAELVERWLRDVAPADDRASTTVTSLRSVLAPFVDALGHMNARDLRPEHVEDVLRSKTDDGSWGRSTLGRSRSTLVRVLRWAQRREIVDRNAADLADLPVTSRPQREGRALDDDEVGALLAACDGHRLAALWRLALSLGLRPGELSGLTWPDVDLEENEVHIRHRLVKRPGEGWRWIDPKGRANRGRRSLRVPPSAVASLREHRRQQLEERMAAGELWSDDWPGLVFSTEIGTPLDPANLRRTLKRLAESAGIEGDLRRYDLRTTAATHLASAGVRLEDVADTLGHTDTRLARAVYTKATGRTIEATGVDRLSG